MVDMSLPIDIDGDDPRLLAKEMLFELNEAIAHCDGVCPDFHGVLDEARAHLDRFLSDHENPATFELQLACSKAASALEVWRSLCGEEHSSC